LKRVAGEGFEKEYRDVRFAVQEAGVLAEVGEIAQLAKSGKAPTLSIAVRDRTGTGVGTGTGTGVGTGTGTGSKIPFAAKT